MGDSLDNNAERLIAEARAASNKLRKALPKTDQVVTSASNALKEVQQLGNITQLVGHLHSGDAEKVTHATSRLADILPRISAGDTLERAQHFAHEELEKLTAIVNKTHKENARAWKNLPKKAKGLAKETVEDAEKVPGMLGNTFTKIAKRYDKSMEDKSHGAKVGISAAMSTLGFVGIIMGASTIYSASTNGIKQRLQKHDDGTVDVKVSTLTGTERLLKLASGIGIAGAGIGAIMLSARNGDHSHGM